MTTDTPVPSGTPDGERADLLETLAAHREFLRCTVRGLTDEQARQRTTASALTLGGLVKHVAATEARWARFVVEGTAAMAPPSDAAGAGAWTDGFRLLPGETLAGVLAEYAEVARRTDDLVRTLPDLDVAHPLPEAPWFPPGATRSARRVFLHIVAETAQHAGHADILRESLDGQKTMG
ncbi:DinB family protein [Blastococcus sp. MG754426]|uniref:DinB family protein n=1 Tax=unclassified Blastococcus TaxID=2619396 RepID=UPI001EF0E059|nr:MULTISPECIES: DinB family protein [unclassified Blastococcus]MCF6508089.1 DinB family protein [Blastococcus sp. MG754426]MCF6511583.1 DinB family protein [Blastococcus sp. MG754427]MCF6733746.1 DinB family protein [Blastococcus sp. KM273129]